MANLNEELDDWHHSVRSRNELTYNDILRKSFSASTCQLIINSAESEIPANELLEFAANLMSFFSGNASFETHSWIVKEFNPHSRERQLIIDAGKFCAGISTPIPKRNTSTQLIDWHPALDFLSRVNSGLLAFESIAVLDPCPRLFRWADHSSYIYLNAAGIKGDAHSLRYQAVKPLDYDRPFIHDLSALELTEVKRWLQFCLKYEHFIAERNLYIVPSRFPDWIVSYSSGQEAENPKFGDFKRVLSSAIRPASEPMFQRFNRREWLNGNSDDLLERLFWQSHYLGRGAISIDSLEHAEWLISQLSGIYNDVGMGSDAETSISSHIFRLRYGLKLEHLSPDEIRTVRDSDEIVASLRDIVNEVGSLALISGDQVTSKFQALSHRFREFEEQVASIRDSSNFFSSILVPSRDAGLAAIGAGASTLMTSAEASLIAWAGLGAAFPLLVLLPFHLSKGLEQRRVSVTASLLLTRLQA